MNGEAFLLSAEQEQHAREIGYLETTCPDCEGSGKISTTNASSATGWITRPCSTCGTIGRVWATEREWEKHRRGVQNQIKNDRQVAEILKRAKRGRPSKE
ncbi:MAG: hypothetical protein JXQ29_03080 [Planctomycetes bacterium]|nr:hypothetical protein [Planctomycetota bacterium]